MCVCGFLEGGVGNDVYLWISGGDEKKGVFLDFGIFEFLKGDGGGWGRGERGGRGDIIDI